MARETILKTTIRADGAVIAEIPGFDPIVCNPALFPDNIQTQCRAYGAREKMTNAASLSRDPETGLPATAAAKRERVLRVIEAMMAGQWEVRGAGVTSDDTILMQAIAEACEIGADAARETVLAWSTTERRAMTEDPTIAPIFQRLRAEATKRAAAGVDTTALLAKFKKA